MKCPKCGAVIQGQERLCPVCGNDPTAKKENLKSEVARKGFGGFKLLFLIALVICGIVLWKGLKAEAPTDVIVEQLEALKDNKTTEAYYAYTSKDFQNVTSLDKFKDFVKAYPILTQSNKVELSVKDTPDDDIKIVEGALTGPNNSLLPIEYQVIQENSKWKILFIRFLINVANDEPELKVPTISQKGMQNLEEAKTQSPNVLEFNSNDLTKVVEGQLDAIRQGEVSQAYYNFTSTKFRDKMNFAQFSKFVNSHPVLVLNKSLSIDELNVDNNIVHFVVNLTSSSGITHKVNYKMEEENGQWKISSMNLVDKTGMNIVFEKPIAPVVFDKAVFGTQIDDKGTILDPGKVLKAHQSDIYVDLFIKKASQGDIIQVEFEYLDNSTKIPVMAYTIPKEGNQMITFSFSPPPEGWSKGNYQITLTSLSGGKSIFPFTIE